MFLPLRGFMYLSCSVPGHMNPCALMLRCLLLRGLARNNSPHPRLATLINESPDLTEVMPSAGSSNTILIVLRANDQLHDKS